MTREEILTTIKPYFDAEELVCNHTMKAKSNPMQFLDTMYLWCLLIIRRDILRKPMWCNNHDSGTHQRGLRCNLCELVKSKNVVYLTAHGFGKAGDFTVVGMTAEEARQKIKEFQHLLPCPIRLEAGVSWLHFDVMPNDKGVTVYEFKV